MSRTRGSLLALSLLAAVIGVAGLIAGAGGRGADGSAISPSTLDGTWVDPDGNGTLERGPGEPLVERTDLAPAAPADQTLATLVQITDAHLRDEESPARASLLDRTDPDLNSAFRPQEALSPQVLESIVDATNAVGPDAVIFSGDQVDSAQRNELDQFLGVVEGGPVDPGSGAPGYDGPQEATNPDPFFYRPDVDAPVHPGLLDAAQQPFESPGLTAPWLPLVGNHDLLVQGEVPASAALERLATGGRLLTALRPDLRLPKVLRSGRADSTLTPGVVNAVIGNGLPGPTRRVSADPRRSYVPQARMVARLRAGSEEPGRGALMNASLGVGGVRVITLDLTDRTGGSGGVVAPGQPRFLARALARAQGQPVIVVSHHPIASSVGGQRLLAVLDRAANVIATLSGHTHVNSIESRPSAAGGYWRISTASLADFPQQARVLRVLATAGGGIAIETWMIDGVGSPLAATARKLAYLDAQGGRPQGDAGRPSDRNARLFLP